MRFGVKNETTRRGYEMCMRPHNNETLSYLVREMFGYFSSGILLLCLAKEYKYIDVVGIFE